MHHIGDAPHKRRVDVLHQVGGQHAHPVVILDLLEQIGHLHVGVPVVGVLYVAPLAEDGVALVEEQDAIGIAGLVEHGLQVLFRFADILADDLGDVDLIHLHVQLPGDHLGAHGLARARRPCKQDGQALAIAQLFFKAPFLIDPVLVADMVAGLLHQPLLGLGQHHVHPGVAGLHPPGQLIQPMHHLPVAASVYGAVIQGLILDPAKARRLHGRPFDLPGHEAELDGKLLELHLGFHGDLGKVMGKQGQPFRFFGGGDGELHRGRPHRPGYPPLGQQEHRLPADSGLGNGLGQGRGRRLHLPLRPRGIQPVEAYIGVQ